jgi:hypothetical protein
MKTTVMLLLTNDTELEDAVAEALLELGGVSHLTRDPGDTLETVCGVHDIDLAVIDFEHGPHGMTLLSAISMLREDLPAIVITRRHCLFFKTGFDRTTCGRDSKILRNESRTGLGLTREIENASNEGHCFPRAEQYSH